MSSISSTHRSTLTRIGIWTASSAAALAAVSYASVLISSWLIDAVQNRDGSSAPERGQIGGYFSGVGAVFSGLALMALVITLLMQQQELRMQRAELSDQRKELALTRVELSRTAQADLRALHLELTKMVMNDPELAEVGNDYPDATNAERRRLLFANILYQHLYLSSEWEEHTEEEIMVHARNLIRSEVFRRYWTASRDAKLALPEGRERRFAQVFDTAIAAQPPDPPA